MQLQSLLTVGTACLSFAGTSFAVPVSHSKTQKLSTTASSNEAVNTTGYQQSKNVSICKKMAAINFLHEKPLPLRELPSDLKDLDKLKKNIYDADSDTLILIGMEFGYFRPGFTPCPDLTLRSRLLSGIEKHRKMQTKKSMHDSYRLHKNKTLATRDFEHFLDLLGLGHDHSNKTLAPRDWEGILEILGLEHAESNKTLATRDLKEDFFQLLGLDHDHSNKTLVARNWDDFLTIFGVDNNDSNKTLATRDLDPVKEALLKGWNWNKTAKAHPSHVEHKRPHFPKTNAKGRPFPLFTNHTKSTHHIMKPHHQNATEFKLWIESLLKAKANKHVHRRSNETEKLRNDLKNDLFLIPFLGHIKNATAEAFMNSVAEKHLHRRSNETETGAEKLEHALSLFPFFKLIKDISDKNVTDETQFAAFIESEFGKVEADFPVLNVTNSGNFTQKDEAAPVESDTSRFDWSELLRDDWSDAARDPFALQAYKKSNSTLSNTTELIAATPALDEDEDDEDEEAPTKNEYDDAFLREVAVEKMVDNLFLAMTLSDDIRERVRDIMANQTKLVDEHLATMKTFMMEDLDKLEEDSNVARSVEKNKNPVDVVFQENNILAYPGS